VRGRPVATPSLSIAVSTRRTWLEAGFWMVTVASLSLLVGGEIEARGGQRAAAGIAVDGHAGDTKSIHSAEKAGIIGRLDIPALSLSVPITGDYDSRSLLRGVGHIPGTAVPGGLGNLVLAGHRDTFFRPLRRVKDGMKIDVTTTTGRWEYLIDSTEIVNPEQTDILDIGSRPEMTLITCFPFDFIGAAPKRFIVHAHLLSAASI
jgi:sortase A